jgi:hypothetical protein
MALAAALWARMGIAIAKLFNEPGPDHGSKEEGSGQADQDP